MALNLGNPALDPYIQKMIGRPQGLFNPYDAMQTYQQTYKEPADNAFSYNQYSDVINALNSLATGLPATNVNQNNQGINTVQERIQNLAQLKPEDSANQQLNWGMGAYNQNAQPESWVAKHPYKTAGIGAIISTILTGNPVAGAVIGYSDSTIAKNNYMKNKNKFRNDLILKSSEGLSASSQAITLQNLASGLNSSTKAQGQNIKNQQELDTATSTLQNLTLRGMGSQGINQITGEPLMLNDSQRKAVNDAMAFSASPELLGKPSEEMFNKYYGNVEPKYQGQLKPDNKLLTQYQESKDKINELGGYDRVKEMTTSPDIDKADRITLTNLLKHHEQLYSKIQPQPLQGGVITQAIPQDQSKILPIGFTPENYKSVIDQIKKGVDAKEKEIDDALKRGTNNRNVDSQISKRELEKFNIQDLINHRDAKYQRDIEKDKDNVFSQGTVITTYKGEKVKINLNDMYATYATLIQGTPEEQARAKKGAAELIRINPKNAAVIKNINNALGIGKKTKQGLPISTDGGKTFNKMEL